MASQSSQSEKQWKVGLLLSGVLIFLSFVTMLIPLALYHVAQVGATLKLRTTYALMAAVIFGSFFLGVTFGIDIFLLGAFVGAFWAPLFAVAVYQRKKNRSMYLSAFLFFVPALLVIGMAFWVPEIVSLESFLRARLEMLDSQMRLPPLEGTERAQFFLDTWKQTFEHTIVTPGFAILAKVAAYSPWQRVAWFVFDSDAAYLFIFGLLFNALASLVFLDNAFEQIEKLTAVVRYVLRSPSMFPAQLVEAMSRFPMKSESESALEVESHKKISEETRSGLQAFVMPKHARERVYLSGTEFRLIAKQKHWQLKNFALPLWVVILGIGSLVSLVLKYKTPEGIITEGASAPWGAVVALGGVFGALILAITAVQGMLVLYQRLVPFGLMLVLLAILTVGLTVGFDPYLALGVFGSLGLLDYLYDFRGRIGGQRASQPTAT